MKLFGYELSLRAEQRDSGLSGLTNSEDWLLQAILGRVASSTGVTVTPLRMMGIATCFACIRVKATALASLPLVLYKADGKNGKVRAYEHPLFSLLSDAPNLEMSAYDFVSVMASHLSLRQNAFAEIMRDIDGEVTGLYPIDPMDISVVRNPRNNALQYKFLRNGTNFGLEEILHLRGYSRSGLMGIDHSANLQEVFALAIALQDNAAKFFGNGSRPSGVLEHPGSLSAEAQDRLRTQMEQSTGGRNAYRTMILEEGLKYAATRSENKDSQFQEAREYQDLQICRVFGVPPHKVGITGNSPRANVEQENISFVVDTLRPDCILWEKMLNLRLLTKDERSAGYHFEFKLDAMLRGDKPSRFAAHAIGIQWGFLSPNDVREEEGLNPIAEGNIYFQPLNMTRLGSAPAAVANMTDSKAPPNGVPTPLPLDQTPPEPTGGDASEKNIPELQTKPKKIAVVEDASILKV